MTTRLALALAASLGLAMPAYAQDAAPATAEAATAANPFFAESPLPLHYPQFDKIKDSDFAPAFDAGMAEQLKEIDAIANNPEAPSFDNTILAMEKSGQQLNRAQTVFFSLVGADTNDARNKLRADYAAKFAAHSDAIALNGKLFARIAALYDKRDTLGLDAEGVRLVERYHTDFVRAGAKLSDADKAKLKAMNSELAELGSKFSDNVLKDVNASAVVIDDVKQLDGFTPEQIAAAADVAKARKLDGKYVITLLNTTGQPPESELTDRATRQKLHEASVARGSHGGEFDNRAIISRIMKLRAERANLLGYPNHAAYVLEDETAKTPQAVNDMLGKLAPAAVANAKREAADLQAMIKKEGGDFRTGAVGLVLLYREGAQGQVQLRRIPAQAVFRVEQRAGERRVLRRQPAVRPDLQEAHRPAGVPPRRARPTTCSTPTASSWPSSSPTCTRASPSAAARG